MYGIAEIETQRQIIQRELDRLKTQEQRNILGQFSTPMILAHDILRNALKIMPKGDRIRFLDPAVGTGAFFSALNHLSLPTCIEAATGYEIDEHYGKPAIDLWSDSILDYQLDDFTKVAPPIDENQKFNLIICNPPYVRHHHINGQKERLHMEAIAAAKMNLSGLAGLYCYFMALSHRWMRSNAIAGWLIPSEFMDVNYGGAPISQFKPILPSPRHILGIEVASDDRWIAAIDPQLFVLDCKLAISEIEYLYPELYAYLQVGIKIGVADRYLCKSRKLWYAQEHRAESRFYCTYMGRSDKNRKKSFRFILNHSKAIVANSYLILYPKPEVAAVIAKYPEMVATFFEALNAITEKVMIDEGRVYGGGMHKLEPRELANVPAPELLRSIETINRSIESKQHGLPHYLKPKQSNYSHHNASIL